MRLYVSVLALALLIGAAPASAAPEAPSAGHPTPVAAPPAAAPPDATGPDATTPPGATGPAAVTSAPIPPVAPGTLWSAPLPGAPVTRHFEAPATPYGPGHRGVDLAAVPGATVLAAGDGVVVFAGSVAGRPVVSIDHPGGLRTTYEPVARSIGAGTAVVRGSPIGVLAAGHAGCPAEACLHWGLRRGEVYLDPLALLALPRIRLLPLDPSAT